MIYILLYSACYQVYERKIIIDDSNEVIFQYEITSKKFHQRESFHQERSLNTVPIVHRLPNNRNLIS
jgi:hypothetical protein